MNQPVLPTQEDSGPPIPELTLKVGSRKVTVSVQTELLYNTVILRVYRNCSDDSDVLEEAVEYYAE